MVKNTTTVVPASVAEVSPVALTITTTEGTLSASDISCDILSLPSASIAYLLSYGWAKSLQDAAAGATKAAADAFRADGDEFGKMCETLGSDPDHTRATHTPESFGIAYAQALRTARADRITSGTMGVRVAGTGRTDTLTRTMNTIAKERITAAYRAKGKPMPKMEALTDTITLLLTKYDADIRAEAQRRLDTTTSGSNINDILGL